MATAIVRHNSYVPVVSLPAQSAVHPPKQRGSVYEIVTARILEQLARGGVVRGLPNCRAI
jgi:hypothetical protein